MAGHIHAGPQKQAPRPWSGLMRGYSLGGYGEVKLCFTFSSPEHSTRLLLCLPLSAFCFRLLLFLLNFCLCHYLYFAANFIYQMQSENACHNGESSLYYFFSSLQHHIVEFHHFPEQTSAASLRLSFWTTCFISLFVVLSPPAQHA